MLYISIDLSHALNNFFVIFKDSRETCRDKIQNFKMDHDRSSIIQLIENPWIKFIPFWISQRSKTIISIIVRSVIIIIGYYCQFSHFYPPPLFLPFLTRVNRWPIILTCSYSEIIIQGLHRAPRKSCAKLLN